LPALFSRHYEALASPDLGTADPVGVADAPVSMLDLLAPVVAGAVA
jgi:hypothetical protein